MTSLLYRTLFLFRLETRLWSNTIEWEDKTKVFVVGAWQ